MTSVPETLPTPRYIDTADRSPLTFTICSLVADQGRYDRLLGSFSRVGFTPDTTEFLAADNRNGNQFDGYTWQKALLAQARGRYVIFCHDDVEAIHDGPDHLLGLLRDLDRLDPRWLLAGVAGGLWHSQAPGGESLALHISDSLGEDRRFGTLPSRVETLDECFILMRRLRPVVGSYDLSGFHFYGADLCLQAELAGGTAYAIDFHLRHHGKGAMGESFEQCKQAFSQKYLAYFPDRRLRCTTGRLRLPTNLTPQKGSPILRWARRMGWRWWSG